MYPEPRRPSVALIHRRDSPTPGSTRDHHGMRVTHGDRRRATGNCCGHRGSRQRGRPQRAGRPRRGRRARLVTLDGSVAEGLDATRRQREALLAMNGTTTVNTRSTIEVGALTVLSNARTPCTEEGRCPRTRVMRLGAGRHVTAWRAARPTGAASTSSTAPSREAAVRRMPEPLDTDYAADRSRRS
jgi:hypothetical protein